MDSIASHFIDKQVFAVGCLENEVILDEEEKKQSVFSGKNRLWFEKGIFMTSRAKNFETGPTAWASGGSAVFDRKKWLKLGGFDARYYPAYWEDIDLSFQARKQGWKVIFDSQAKVDHNHETTNQSAFGQKKIIRMSWKNADAFTWKNGTLWQKIAFLLWRPYWWIQRARLSFSK